MADRQAYRISSFCEAFAIGRSRAYEEINAGRLKTFKLGRMTFISQQSAHDWLLLCEQESNKNSVSNAKEVRALR
jgi:hypothetical protein